MAGGAGGGTKVEVSPVSCGRNASSGLGTDVTHGYGGWGSRFGAVGAVLGRKALLLVSALE